MKEFLCRSRWSFVDRLAFAVSLAIAGLWSYWIATDISDFIEVNEVGVIQRPDLIEVVVSRKLHRDFSGSYRVTIRAANEGYQVCDTGYVDVNYTARSAVGLPTQLPSPMPVQYWAYGGRCTDVLSRGLPSGDYAMITCHKINHILTVLPGKERCWAPALFSITEQVNG